ncbi:hypothetical protein [Myroides guanonis]|uniref:SWIM-type domain-containing protein n=1 Tax=Myroides guanonis TaxID=1150112 RepID=A0A1I3TYN7_9FLAO|nr:hypothetical protein [Myroides guanonis]SFJ74647.1 hypothetical protein SAMN04487893_1152 [Myroides guanonis]
MKVTDILKGIPKATLKKIESVLVRELDEEKKGVFVSYVDEGDSTFDVRLEVFENKLIKHLCDCGVDEEYCLHKLAVLKSLKSANKSTLKVEKKKRTRKLSESEILIMNLDKDAIASWMQSLFKVNKDLELQFLLQFGKQEVHYIPEDVKLLINEAIKSVVGKRKKLDAREVKKVADLVNQSLEGVKEFILIHSHQETVIDLTNAVYECISDFESRVTYTSVRMLRVLDAFIEHVALSIVQIKDVSALKNMFRKIWDNVFKLNNETYSRCDFELLKYVFSSCTVEQNVFFVSETIKEMERLGISFDSVSMEVKSFFLDVLVSDSLIKEYKNYFVPIRFENEFNMKLLNILKDVDGDLMEEYALTIINSNREEKYNFAYYQILQDWYLSINDLEKVVKYKKLLFLYNRSVEEYMYILNNDDISSFKKFRQYLFKHLQSEFHKRKRSEDFVFALLDAEKDYSEMLTYIDYHIRFHVFFPYLNELFSFNKEELLKRLLFIGKYSLYGEEVHDGAVEFVVANYSKEHLLLQLNSEIVGRHSFNETLLLALN